MSYGSLSKTIVNHYNKISYTLDRTTYSDIKIFKTDPSTESIAPVAYITGNKQEMQNMNPPSPTKSDKYHSKAVRHIMPTF